MPLISETDKAWIAGFIDGEGWVGMAKQVRENRPSPTYRAQVKGSNTNKAALNFCVQRHGGKVLTGQVVYQWSPPAATIRQLLIDILPYLIIKKEQAIVVLAYLDWRDRRENIDATMKEDTHKRLKELNRNKFSKEKKNAIKKS